jgi:hypothetical protein
VLLICPDDLEDFEVDVSDACDRDPGECFVAEVSDAGADFGTG